MSEVVYAEGSVILSGRGEVRIYIKKKYWSKLKALVGREVKMLLITE